VVPNMDEHGEHPGSSISFCKVRSVLGRESSKMSFCLHFSCASIAFTKKKRITTVTMMWHQEKSDLWRTANLNRKVVTEGIFYQELLGRVWTTSQIRPGHAKKLSVKQLSFCICPFRMQRPSVPHKSWGTGSVSGACIVRLASLGLRPLFPSPLQPYLFPARLSDI